MAGPSKGVVADLTSISAVLATILTQVKDITSSAGGAAGAVGDATKAVGGGAGGSRVKAGKGGSALKLADFSSHADAPGMKGGDRGAKFTTYGASSSSSISSTSVSTKAPFREVARGEGAARVAMGATSMGVGIAKALFTGVPDPDEVMAAGSRFYQAALTQNVSDDVMKRAAMRSGLARTGKQDEIAQFMSNSGVSFSGAQNSTWQTQSRATSNAVQYLNMDPMAAAAAITGLNSGATSKNMMLNMGVYTSDPTTGKELSSEGIFQQIHQRLKSGRRENTGQAGIDEINASWYRGNLKESLIGSGLSEDQADLYKQWELAKAGGQSFDLSKAEDMQKAAKAQTAKGNENPNTPAYDQAESQAKLFNTYQDKYLEGIKAGTDALTGFNKLMEALSDALGPVTGFLAVLAGSNGLGALTAGITGVVASFSLLKGVISSLTGGGKGGGAGGTGGAGGKGKVTDPYPLRGEKGYKAPKGSSGAGGKGVPGMSAAKNVGTALGGVAKSAAGAVGKGVLRALPGVGTALGMAWEASDAYARGADMKNKGLDEAIGSSWNWGNFAMAAGVGALGGALAGAPALGVGAIPGAIGGALLGAGGYAAANVFGTSAGWAWGGQGSQGSTVGTGSISPPANSTQKFIRPVGGAISSPYGARIAPTAGASTMHKGVDFQAAQGTPVKASASGTVTSAGFDNAKGNNITIKHGGGYETNYFHLSVKQVQNGASVTQGQVIGLVGSTGLSTGAHLHFEVKYNGSHIDPMTVLNGSVSIPVTGNSNDTQSNATSSPMGTIPNQSSVISGIAGTLADTSKVSAYQGASSAGGAGTSTAGMTSGGGGNGRNNNNSNLGPAGRSSSMYLPGAPSAKQGDAYVAQDGPVNIHAGEAVLTAEQAADWRKAMREGGVGGGKKGGGDVTINVTVANSSQAEAQKFAELVKTYLDNDKRMSRMGSR